MNDLSPEARAILDAARAADDPTAEDRARMRALVLASAATAGAATLGAAAAAHATSHVAAGATSISLTVKIVTSLLVVSAVGAGVVMYQQGEEGREPNTQRRRAVSGAVAVPAPAPAAAPVPEPVAAPVSVPAPVAAPASGPAHIAADLPSAARLPSRPSPSARRTLSSSPSSPPPSLPSSTLDAELALIRNAQLALSRGDAAGALRQLDAHRTEFAQGLLRPERRAARVSALCRLDRVEEARAEAALLVRESPGSALAARVREPCAPQGNPRKG